MVSVHSTTSLVENAAGVFRSSYGMTELNSYLGSVSCCKLHVPFGKVLQVMGGCVKGVVGEHPAIKATAHGGKNQPCHALAKVLRADREFAKAALGFQIGGYQFLEENQLRGTKRWGTGALVSLSSFGTGYCYLILMRPEFRFRIARILGPVPYLADILVFFRVAGRSVMSVEFRSVNQRVMHCEVSGAPRVGKRVFSELAGLLELEPSMRMGMDVGASANFLNDVKVVVRGRCEVCDVDDVVVEGHYARCRVPLRVDLAAQLIGDALHALDVKRMVVAVYPTGTYYTEVAKFYICAKAQSAYMRDVQCADDYKGHSDHSVANEFERLYSGEFRLEYLRWLCDELGVDTQELTKYLDVDLSRSPHLNLFDLSDMGFGDWGCVCCFVVAVCIPLVIVGFLI